jgi:hypothetical protein
MRYINNSHLQRLANLADIEAAKKEIAVLDEEVRSTYIDDNAERWTALRPALWALGSCKCWYSEASIQQQEGHVEHYRPKKRLWGARHTGYWWRAFDWTNFRIAHPTVNLRVTDYLSGKKAGKGSYFPLRDGNQRAESEVDEANEEPVLLDPTNPADCNLLCFDTCDGKPVPRYSVEEDEWRHIRARDSIEYYHLDEGTWNYKRKDLMDDVGVLCDKIIKVVSLEPIDRDNYDGLINELLVYLEPLSEFTSAALQVVCEKGLLEHIAPLPT